MKPLQKSKIKILCVTHCSPDSKGGIESHVSRVCRFISSNFQDLSIKYVFFSREEDKITKINSRLETQQIKSMYIFGGMYPILLLPQVFSLVRAISQFKPDIIHTHNRYVFSTWVAQVYGLIMRIPIVHTEHASSSNLFDSRLITFISTFLNKTLIGFLLKRCSVVTVVSDAARAFMETEFKLKGVKVINNFIDPVECEEAIKESVQLTNGSVKPGKLNILFASRLVQTKRYRLFLELVKKYHNDKRLNFVMIGDGPGISEVREVLSKGYSNFSYLGLVDRGKCLALISACDVFVNLSSLEGLSTLLLEARYFGTKIVTTDITANREALGGYWLVYFCKPYVESVYREICLLSNKERISTKISFPSKFVLSESAKKYVEVYEALTFDK